MGWTLRVVGIRFRSRSHFVWFLACMFELLCYMAVRVASAGPLPFPSIAISILVHLGVSLLAVALVLGELADGEVFSSDCIWFNVLMAAAIACTAVF